LSGQTHCRDENRADIFGAAARLRRLAQPSMSAQAPVRVPPMAILPLRDGDPPLPTPLAPSQSTSAPEILRCAEDLGIPWKRILLGEIEAEQKLRRYVSDIERECPLPSALTVLSFSMMQSWRVRDQIESLACQARGASMRGAVRQLRIVFRRLIGAGDRDRIALAQHFWFAYQRVLLLQRACRAAARSRGTTAERLAFVCSISRCCFDDAAWAVCQEGSPGRGHRLDAAVRKVREEGFLIPRAETEARSLAALRRIVLASARDLGRRPSRGRKPDPVSSPQRVRLPVHAI
jgi:hypothetical protein